MRGVSFDLEPGEALGVVGKNGAGKSTLLKLVAGLLVPTEGEVGHDGRVAALLDLGMGFNAEFTGRQNAFHAAGLMGFGRDAIREQMSGIEAFADIDGYFDQPVRTYSTGMQLRVAFAVATAFRPEILVIDEALAVGDAAFQRKCFQRIETFRAAGTALLLVSHNTETIKRICTRTLLINKGGLQLIGPASTVCDEYERLLFAGDKPDGAERAAEPHRFDETLTASSSEVTYGNGKAEIISSSLESPNGQQINVLDTGHPFVWRYSVRFNEPVAGPVFGMMLRTAEGVAVYGTDSMQLGHPQRDFSSGESVDVCFHLSNQLAPGVYYLNCGVRVDLEDRVEFLTRRLDTTLIRITQRQSSTVALGLLDMQARLSVTAAGKISA